MGKRSGNRIFIMWQDGIADRVKAIAGPITASLGMELVAVEAAVEHGRRLMRVYIDKPEGVTLDDCADVSMELGLALDVADPINERYVLEVSSPGLDRPLIKEGDYIRFAGRKVRLRTKAPVEGRRNFKATIVGAKDGATTVTDEDGRRWELEIANIEKARLEIEL
ncbi:MAG: ribosome maturation factor RimP [Deltaproteobacteria bacterium]|nr:ribosome maturation factor RimP [Deltaproteobacteria bacterium]